MPNTEVRWVSSADTFTNPNMVVDLTGIAVGESMIVLHYLGSQGVAVTPPSGWSTLFPLTNFGSRAVVGFYRTKTASSETSATFTASASLGGWSRALIGVLGALPADWIIGPFWTRSLHGTSTTNVIDGVVTTVANSVAAVFSFENTSTMESPNSIAGVNNGFTEIGYKAQFAEAQRIETIWAGTKTIPVPGDVGDTTVTYRNTQTSNGSGIMLGFPPVSSAGVPVKTGNGSSALLSYMDGSGNRKSPLAARVFKPGFATAAQFYDTPGATVVHRCGATDFPEISEYAADQSVLYGFGALEFPCNRTSDGWWFGHHDQTLDRVTGLSGLPNISTMTRAEVEAYANVLNPISGHPSRPFYGLEEFLEKFGQTHVLMLDPKFSFAFNDEFMQICESIVDPARMIWKYQLGTQGSTATSDAALSALNRGWGATMAGIFTTDIDSGSFADHANRPGWTSFALDWNAAQSYWDVLLATGKKIVGNLPSTQLAYDAAIAKGADVVKCSSVKSITPVSI